MISAATAGTMALPRARSLPTRAGIPCSKSRIGAAFDAQQEAHNV